MRARILAMKMPFTPHGKITTNTMLNTKIPNEEIIPATTHSTFLPNPRAICVTTSKNDITMSSMKHCHT